MAKKLIRVPKSEIGNKVGRLIEKEVSLVLSDNTVALGKIVALKSEVLQVEIMRGRCIDVKITDIMEIVYDKPAETV